MGSPQTLVTVSEAESPAQEFPGTVHPTCTRTPTVILLLYSYGPVVGVIVPVLGDGRGARRSESGVSTGRGADPTSPRPSSPRLVRVTRLPTFVCRT